MSRDPPPAVIGALKVAPGGIAVLLNLSIPGLLAAPNKSIPKMGDFFRFLSVLSADTSDLPRILPERHCRHKQLSALQQLFTASAIPYVVHALLERHLLRPVRLPVYWPNHSPTVHAGPMFAGFDC